VKNLAGACDNTPDLRSGENAMATTQSTLETVSDESDDNCLCDSDHDLGCFEHFSAEDS
jgi:hypothetical protein